MEHASQHRQCAVDQLDYTILDVDVVRAFLGWLEQKRNNGARTRNQRLAVIKTFARYVASVAPEHLERCRRIRELTPARFEKPEVEYLEDDEVLRIVQAIDPATQPRDRALFLLLYNTGARVQELVDLDLGDLRLNPVPIVTLQGKGRKQRTCPLWDRTREALEQWIAQRTDASGPLFLNAHGRRLSRSGVAYILRCAGVDITTIAAWLGHSQLTTTHGYIEINLRMKQKAIVATVEKLPELSQGRYPEGDLLTWLRQPWSDAVLCRVATANVRELTNKGPANPHNQTLRITLPPCVRSR